MGADVQFDGLGNARVETMLVTEPAGTACPTRFPGRRRWFAFGKTRNVVCAGVLLVAACQGAPEAPAPVLTLVPAALRVTGSATAIGDQTLCLGAGASAVATLYVHQPTVTMTITARNQGGTGTPVLVIRVGAAEVAAEAIAAAEPQPFTYRSRTEQGEQQLQLAVREGTAGGICIDQIAITQP